MKLETVRGWEEPLTIAVMGYATNPSDLDADRAARNLALNVARNLSSSAIFAIPRPWSNASDGAQSSKEAAEFFNFTKLTTYRLVFQASPLEGEIWIHWHLFDPFYSRVMGEGQLPLAALDIPETPLAVSDRVFERLTGLPGTFNSKLLYVRSGDQLRSELPYVLELANADGTDSKVIHETAAPILSPAWSPDAKTIAYVTLTDGLPVTMLQNLKPNAVRRLDIGNDRAGVSSPAFSPDGQELAVAVTENGNTDIHVLNLRTEKLVRLTWRLAVDTDPVWSPDGKSIVFASDRSGASQLYLRNLEDDDAVRISFGKGTAHRPRFLPGGKKLVFIRRQDSQSSLMTLDLESGKSALVSELFGCEDPDISPDGALVVCAITDQKGQRLLALLSMDGRVEQRLSIPEGALWAPAWSPLWRDPLRVGAR